jgi:pyruvate,water dikinase
MAVVVQRMVVPDAAGVLFTADPVTYDRRVVAIEATYGLGEALVDGRVDADTYRVRDGEVVEKALGRKRIAVHAVPSGGTREEAVAPERQAEPALTDAQAVRLAALGRSIEAHLGSPQDVEWCLAGDDLLVVQSRPITTLFPVPEAGEGKHVFVSVGHQQMLTDPIRPLGLSVWQLTAFRPMYHAGGRLFVDVAGDLAVPATRRALLEGFANADPLTGDALRIVAGRGDLVPAIEDDVPAAPPAAAAPALIDADPGLVAGLVARSEASLADLRRDIATKSGEDLLDFVVADLQELKRIVFDPRSRQATMAGMEATNWLNDRMREWLGETNAADPLAQSAPGNVTSEMGLALLAVADAVRPHPEVVAFLEGAGEDFLDGLAALPGGEDARAAIVAYLDTYGMRCTGEIDITRPRWSERPVTLVPAILGNVRSFEPGEARRRFEQGRREAERAERDLLERLRALPDGEEKAAETKAMIDRVRTFIGYREYPKYVIVNRYFVYKQALLREADRLVEDGVLHDREDVFSLTFDELREAVRTRSVDSRLVSLRKEEHRSYRALTPPRVMTSDGEVIAGAYRRGDVPAGALPGLAVSAGTVEGRARVVLDLAEADFAPGDILVTAYTDPSWTPLFVAITGLVTEVGGLMTHGAVIAREYGLPAVVGVERATEVIRDGQRIRVHGSEGYVEVLG